MFFISFKKSWTDNERNNTSLIVFAIGVFFIYNVHYSSVLIHMYNVGIYTFQQRNFVKLKLIWN